VLVLGFSAFSVPANSTAISVQVIYYDFKNGTGTAANGGLIRCNDSTNRLAGSHNPGNGNGNIALRTVNYATNPKSGAAWTVDDVNGIGTNGLTAFGFSVTDASPTSTFSSTILQVTYTPPAIGTFTQSLADLTEAADSDIIAGAALTKTLDAGTLSGTAIVTDEVHGTLSQNLDAATALGDADSIAAATLSQTLDALAEAGEADALVGGAFAQALDELTEIGTGIIPLAGTTDVGLDAATLSGAGVVEEAAVIGSLNLALGALVGAGGSTIPLVADASEVLEDAALSGDADVALTAELAEALEAMGLSGSGVVTAAAATGDLAVSLDALTLVGAATVAVGGGLDVTLGGGGAGGERSWTWVG
jgi:hypothetical protein